MWNNKWALPLVAGIMGIGTNLGVLLLNHDLVATSPTRQYSDSPVLGSAPHAWLVWSDELNKLSADLTTERAGLEDRGKQLDQFEARLQAEREELRKLRAELDLMRKEVSEKIPLVRSAEKQNIKSLAKTYSSMKPADAVAVLRELDDPTVVKILSVMKADMVGSLFQEMAKAKDADGTLAARAARLSDQLRLIRTESSNATQ